MKVVPIILPSGKSSGLEKEYNLVEDVARPLDGNQIVVPRLAGGGGDICLEYLRSFLAVVRTFTKILQNHIAGLLVRARIIH